MKSFGLEWDTYFENICGSVSSQIQAHSGKVILALINWMRQSIEAFYFALNLEKNILGIANMLISIIMANDNDNGSNLNQVSVLRTAVLGDM